MIEYNTKYSKYAKVSDITDVDYGREKLTGDTVKELKYKLKIIIDDSVCCLSIYKAN